MHRYDNETDETVCRNKPPHDEDIVTGLFPI